MSSMILEFIYILVGLILMTLGLRTFMKSKDFFSAAFWFLLGLVFLLGRYVHPFVVGIVLIISTCITLAKKVKKSPFTEVSQEEREKHSLIVGPKIFIPALSIGLVTFFVIQFTNLGGLVGLGLGSICGLIITLIMTKCSPVYIIDDTSGFLQQVGPVLILPQLLGSLGAVFTKVGVGPVIANTFSLLVPAGDIFLGVVIYCVAMAIFTMIMGNAFAAFAFITAGVGVPFVIAQGVNPLIVGALGITSGYCGTLMTPMAANFNIMPATILDMKNKWVLILTQIPIAITLLILHILVMYFWAF